MRRLARVDEGRGPAVVREHRDARSPESHLSDVPLGVSMGNRIAEDGPGPRAIGRGRLVRLLVSPIGVCLSTSPRGVSSPLARCNRERQGWDPCRIARGPGLGAAATPLETGS